MNYKNAYEEMKRLYELLQQENKQLKEQLLVTQTNEETFRLEMEDITRALGLAEDTIFDDVKAFVRSLEIENQKYKEVIDELNDLLIIKKARCLNEDNYVLNVPDLDDILQVLKEVE